MWQVLYIVASVAALDVLHDAWFFWTHRLLHWRPLYRHIHYIHHRRSPCQTADTRDKHGATAQPFGVTFASADRVGLVLLCPLRASYSAAGDWVICHTQLSRQVKHIPLHSGHAWCLPPGPRSHTFFESLACVVFPSVRAWPAGRWRPRRSLGTASMWRRPRWCLPTRS